MLLEVTALCSFRGNGLSQVENPKSRIKLRWVIFCHVNKYCCILEKSIGVESQMKVEPSLAAEPDNCKYKGVG
jgi:hypothetical protein